MLDILQYVYNFFVKVLMYFLKDKLLTSRLFSFNNTILLSYSILTFIIQQMSKNSISITLSRDASRIIDDKKIRKNLLPKQKNQF